MCTPFKTANLFDMYQYIIQIPVDDVDTPTIQSIRKESIPMISDYKFTFVKPNMLPPHLKQQLLPHLKNTNLYLFFNCDEASPFEVVRHLRHKFYSSKKVSLNKPLHTDVTLPVSSAFIPSETAKLQALGIPSRITMGLARTLTPFVFPKGFKNPIGLSLLHKYEFMETILINPTQLFIKQSTTTTLYQICKTELYFQLENDMRRIFYDSFVEGVLNVSMVTKHLSCEKDFYNEASFIMDMYNGISTVFQFELGAGLIQLIEKQKEEVPIPEVISGFITDDYESDPDWSSLFD